MPKLFWMTIAIGLMLLFLTPLPGGLIYLSTGLSLLICTSLPFALFLQGVRRRHGRVNSGFVWIETKLGDRLAKNLLYTRPDADPRKHFARQPRD